MLFHTRDLLVRQRTQTINALRGHLAEFGVVAPQGPAHVHRLASALQDPGSGLPGSVRELGALLLDRIEDLDAKIDGLGRELRARACQDEEAARLMTIPGIGPITAMAVHAFAPPMESFRRGRDFAAWLGLVPRQYTTGGNRPAGKRRSPAAPGRCACARATPTRPLRAPNPEEDRQHDHHQAHRTAPARLRCTDKR